MEEHFRDEVEGPLASFLTRSKLLLCAGLEQLERMCTISIDFTQAVPITIKSRLVKRCSLES